MRGRRRSAEPRLEDAIGALARALRSARASWAVIGGIAVIARGVHRMTTDVDAVIRGDQFQVETLIELLGRHGITPRIANAAEFARANQVLLLEHESGVKVDLSFGWTGFEHEAIAASSRTKFGDVVAPMVSAEDLVIFKAMAARPRDLEDAKALLTMYPSIDLARVKRKLTELANMAAEPELATGLDQILKQLPEAPRAPQQRTAKHRAARRRKRS
jgi:hypothetical protein